MGRVHNIYVRKQDEWVFKAATEKSGLSLSATIAIALQERIDQELAKRKENNDVK